MQLSEVKNYLRIEDDFTEDDNMLNILMSASNDYLKAHIGDEIYTEILKSEPATAKAKVYQLALIAEWYDNRGSEKVSEGLRNILASIGTQLKYGVMPSA